MADFKKILARKNTLIKMGIILLFPVFLRPQAPLNETNVVVLPISMDSLIAYYPLNGNAKDYSGNGHHGEIFGAKPTMDRSGRADHALKFDGLDDYIDLGNSKNFKPDFPITVSAWVNCDRFYGEWLFTNNYDENYYNGVALGFGISGIGTPYITYGNGGLTTPFGRRAFEISAIFELHHWYYYTGIFYDAKKFEIYIDGCPYSGSYTGFATMMTYSDGPALIGKKDTNYDAPPWYFDGVIDGLLIFNRVLTPSEIKLLFEFTE